VIADCKDTAIFISVNKKMKNFLKILLFIEYQ